MSGPLDLTNVFIEDTYQRLIQTDGVYLYDGTGSLFSISGSSNGIAILNNTNNNILTATGNATSINGESRFTFDGSNAVLTGSFNVSGSTTQIGNNTLAGTTRITGSIFINGDIIPEASRSFDLGSETNPWRSLYVQSGSISIQSDIPGGISAIISNANGNITFAGAGFQLKSGSFVPFEVSSTARTIIRVPNIPANDIGGLSVIGSSDGAYQPVINPSGLIHLTSNDNQAARLTVDGFGTSIGAIFAGRHARGTAASPTPTLSGDVLARFAGLGYATSSYFPVVGAVPTSLEFQATENYSTSSYGSRAAFYTYANGAVNRTLSAQIDTTGITIPLTSRLFGTASWAENALTASYVRPLVQDVIITGSLNISGSINVKGTTTFNNTVVFAQSSSIQYLPRVVPDSSPTSSITLDFSKDTLVHVHCTGFSTFTVNCINFTTGSVVELYLTNNAGSTQVNMPGSISSNNLIGKNGAGSFWSMTRPSGYFKFTCIDGTATNTFVIGTVN